MPVRRIIKFLREQYESLQKRFSGTDKKEENDENDGTKNDIVKNDPIETVDPAIKGKEPNLVPAAAA